jgi:hypothetical protein
MTQKPFPVRCFEYHHNERSPYNPAPNYELDHDTLSPPLVGDFLFDSPAHVAYVVKDRFFEIGNDATIMRCGLIVEATDRKFDFPG